MKTATYFFILLLLALPCYSQKEDMLGWEDTRWGMSEEELPNTFKSQLKKLPERNDAFSRGYADYVIQDYELEGRKTTVYFVMDDISNKLAEVYVQYQETESRSSQDAYYNKLETLLTSKYGINGCKERNKSALGERCQWGFSTTTIELSYFWTEKMKYNALTISYRPTLYMPVKKMN